MQHRKIMFVVGLVPVAMACVATPIAIGGREPTPAVSTATPVWTPGPALSSDDPAIVTPIDLHIGRGVHGSWFDLYFTDPANPAGQQFTGGVDERLVQAIDDAHLSIHAAMYNLSLGNVRAALIRAQRRGVDVRLVTESDNLDGDNLQRLIAAGIPVLGDRRQSTMHDKFMVIDGSQLWTGSMNYTGSGVYLDNNCLIRITSDRIAQAYEAEFSEMFVDDRFGQQVGNSTPVPMLQNHGTPIEVLFAPDDRPESRLVNLLDTAQHSVEFLAFSFTSNPLGDALIRAQRAGVRISGVMDQEQSVTNIGSELESFKLAGLDVRLDGNPGQMHEKVLIVDREIVAFGSYNFSRSANEDNDENLLIVHSDTIAALFAEEFDRIYARALP